MSIYIQKLPQKVWYQLPYSDNDGDKFLLTFSTGSCDILLKQGRDSILINKSGDLDWLIDRLTDVRQIIKEEHDLKKKDLSDGK